MKVFGIVGWSGSGCTSLLSRLTDYFSQRGLCVSAVKQSSRQSSESGPPAESRQLHEAGCIEALMVTPDQWYLSHKTSAAGDSSLDRILESMEDVDLVLVEGFKQMYHPKILLVHPRVENQRENTQLLATACPRVVALAAHKPVPGLDDLKLPVFNTEKTHTIAKFISQFCHLPLKAPVTSMTETGLPRYF